MFSARPDFDFKSENIPEFMHNLGRVFLMVMDIICGGLGGTSAAKAWQNKGMDRRHRAECELFGIFESVWLDRLETLPDDVRAALLQPTDEEVAAATRTVLERWAHAVGENTRGLLVAAVREKVMSIRGKLRQPGPFLYAPANESPLPWRLTPDAFKEVDQRIRNMIFPHNTETLVIEGKYTCLLGNM